MGRHHSVRRRFCTRPDNGDTRLDRQFSRPVMRGRTGLDADQAGWQRGEEGQYLAPPQPFAQNYLPLFVNPMSLEDVLCHIKADPDHGHGIPFR